MNGAESLVQTLLGAGVDTCFANPGTSEMHFVAALDRIPGMRCVLALFEGVATGAADGYARLAGKPAATLLHCGPGLANGLANLHNARRAQSAVVNCVGDQATHHRVLDAPLTADTEGWARGASHWVRTARSAATVGADAAVAVQAARTGPGQVATLILPSDTCWDEGGVVAPPLPVPVAAAPAPTTIATIARLYPWDGATMLFLGGSALSERGLRAAARLAAGTGVQLRTPISNARIARGQGRLAIERLPYPVDAACAVLADVRHLILAGARVPVGFFAYPGKPGRLAPATAQVHELARPEQDAAAALEALADQLGLPDAAPPATPRPEPARGAITSEAFAQSLAALLPEQAVVVDESITFGRGFFRGTFGAAPHDWLQLCGGAIGEGLPLATGAAIGAPGRRLVTLQADGSALYTVQALWTQARERLDVTTVIFDNRRYAILQGELTAVGANPGRTALDMLDLGRPDIDWVRVAEGFGVPAARATDMATFNDLFAQSCARSGPFLIALAT